MGYLEIENVQCFEPIHVFECGQCFRWHKESDGSYTGVVKEHVFNIRKSGQTISIQSEMPQPESFMSNYLDLTTDYSKIKQVLSLEDKIMKKATDFGYGMRILRQEHWECLASFILSANNFIPRIIRSVEIIAKMFGKPIEYEGKTYYSFPSANELVDVEEDKLELSGIGFRSKYIKHAARMVASGEIDLDAIEKMDTNTAREELMKIPGVGPKISDCALLYSYSKNDVFPTDVWIKRVVEELYLGREAKLTEIQDFARKKFGSLAGQAQQYLFYYARENKIGK
jgi:N-glycosylase/DNA lyase